MIFGLFKEKYPKLKPEMIEPLDLLISTSDAKKFFTQFMLEIDYLEKGELTEHTHYLVDEIKEHEQCLKGDISDQKLEIKDLREKLKHLKTNLKKCTDGDKETILLDIEECEYGIEIINHDLDESIEDLAAFKADKRSFLVEYINSQTQTQNCQT